MNESNTAGWQIRNAVYPITPVALEPIAARIAVIENFFVHISGLSSKGGKVLPGPGQYDYERAASAKMTVSKWREIRFEKCYPMLSAQVVDRDGRILADDELIIAARSHDECEWTSNKILSITARNNVKPHDDDEALLEGLARVLSNFKFLGPISVRRAHFFWDFYRGYQLKAETKPLTLRDYEYKILERFIKETIEAPGFQCDISPSYYPAPEPPQREFLSQSLNDVFNS